MNVMKKLDLHFTLFIITTVASFLSRETVVVEAASCKQDFSLKAAYCSARGLRSVPADLLPDLTVLDLQNNFLTELKNETFTRYPNLRVLTLYNNNISRMEDGSFYPLKNLVRLLIGDNAYLPSLKRSMFQTDSLANLHAADSNLETFSGDLVACLAEGTILILSGNKLRKINWLSSNYLYTVYLDNNRFRYISTGLFVFNNYANTLDLSGNPIEFIETMVVSSLHVRAIDLMYTRIAFPQLSNLFHGIRLSRFTKEFDLSGEKLHTIENGFFAPLKGKELDKVAIRKNGLQVIDGDGLDGLDGVSQLLLGGNNLEKIEPCMFDGMVALRSLSLNENGMITINSQATPWNLSLLNLNLARNELRALNSSTFLGLKTLKKLDLSNNFKLQVIGNNTFVHLESLAELDMSNNYNILDLTFPYLPRVLATLILESAHYPTSLIRPGNLGTEAPSLATLNLIDNALGAVHMWDAINNKSSFSGLKNLSRLELSNNPLLFLPLGFFKNLSNLQILRLDKCSLSGLEIGLFTDLDDLVLLSLQNNYLNVIPTGLFDKLHNLQYLFLLGNKLRYLDSNLFKYLSSLVELNAAENRLSSLNQSTFEPLNALTSLHLSLNPLVCNCDLKWFPGWLKGSVELINSMDTTCLDSRVTLEPFRGKELITFDPRDECGPNIILYSCLAMAGMALILALGLVYYQRWWIRYRLFLLKLCFIGYEELHDDVERREFQYDLSIMHHEVDNEWVNENLRPVLAERVPDYDRIVCGDEELMLGMHYLDAVHYAAEQSFKTIFVISREALQDQWFILKFRTVLDHVNDVGTEKMILVFIEDIPGDELPFLIRLFLSDHRTYLVWPDNERGQGYFWEELIKNLKVNIRCNHLIPPN